MEEPTFEQVINEHLELKKRNAKLEPAVDVDEDETPEEDEEGWAAASDFDWRD